MAEDKKPTVAEIVAELRKQIVDGRYRICPCTNADCPRHGICAECTAVHRTLGTSLPACLRPLAARLHTPA